MKKPQSLKLGASAQTLPIVFGYGSNLLTTPFVVANLGLANFGLWALTGAMAQYGVLLDLGVSRAIVRYVAFYHAQGDDRKERAVVGGCVMVITLVGLLLTLPALIIPAQLGHLIGIEDAALARTLLVTSVVVLITGLLGLMLTGASTGRGRMVAANIGLAVQRTAVVLGGVIPLIVTPSLTYFAIGSAVGGVFGLVVIVAAIALDERRLVIGVPRAVVMRDLIGFSLKGQAMAVSEIVLFQSAKLLAGIIISPAAAGAYELGSRLALGARAVGTSASTVLGAHLTRSFATDGQEGVRRDYARLMTRNASVSIFPLLLLAATSFSAVPAWLDGSHAEVVWVVIALTVAYTVNVSTAVTIAAAFAFDQLGLVTIAAVAGAVAAIVLELPLAFVGGLGGILVGMVLAITSSSAFGAYVFHRFNRIPLIEFLRPLRGPFLVGVVSTLATVPIGVLCAPTDRSSAVIPLLAGIVVFSAVYMTLGWKLGYLPTINLARRRTSSATESATEQV